MALGEVARTPSRRRLEVCLQVMDNGRGMTTQQLARVFEPFYTLRPSAKPERESTADSQAPRHGAGLGLTISRGLVEQQDGRLEAHSEGLGLGSTFSLTLPQYRGPSIDENVLPETVHAP